jgi:hypothetical protein
MTISIICPNVLVAITADWLMLQFPLLSHERVQAALLRDINTHEIRHDHGYQDQ